MKAKIRIIIGLILMVSCMLSAFVSADLDADIQIVTDGNITSTVANIADGDINSTVINIAEGDVNTELYCEGENCVYDIYNGDINFYSDNGTNTSQTVFNINEYNSYHTTKKSGSGSSGLSFGELIYKLGKNVFKYTNGGSGDKDAVAFFSILDALFVSHNEFHKTENNVDFLAHQVDVLNARVAMLEEQLDMIPDEEYLEAMTGVETSKRMGKKLQTDGGYYCDYELFGDACFKFVVIEKGDNSTYVNEELADEMIVVNVSVTNNTDNQTNSTEE